MERISDGPLRADAGSATVCGQTSRPWLVRPACRCWHGLPCAADSSFACADRKAMKPRPTGVVRSRWGLSRTLMKAPRLWMRSMISMPSIMLRVTNVASTEGDGRRPGTTPGTKISLDVFAMPRRSLRRGAVDPFKAPKAYTLVAETPKPRALAQGFQGLRLRGGR